MKIYHNYYYTFEDMAKSLTLEVFLRTKGGGTIEETWFTSEPAARKALIEELWTRLKHMFTRKGVYFNILDVNYNTNVTEQYLEYLHEPDSEMRINDLLNTIRDTKDKYLEVLLKQNTLKSNIVDDITNETLHYYNDTPQTAGSQIDTIHTTNFSRDVQKIDLGTVSAKLEEVELAMEDKYALWSNHLKRFIILEG